jgi:hypothetical protein
MNRDLRFPFESLPPGCLRKPGNFHLHVDTRDLELLGVIHDQSNLSRLHGEQNTVLKSYKGSQVEEDAHNLPGQGEEYFISVSLKNRHEAVLL